MFLFSHVYEAERKLYDILFSGMKFQHLSDEMNMAVVSTAVRVKCQVHCQPIIIASELAHNSYKAHNITVYPETSQKHFHEADIHSRRSIES